MIGNALRNLARGDRFGRRTRAGLAGVALAIAPSLLGAHASARREPEAPPATKAARHQAGPVVVAATAPETAGVELAGLRSVSATDVPTRPLLVAADSLLRALPPAQRGRAGVPIDAVADLHVLAADSEAHPGVRMDDLADSGRSGLLALVEATWTAPGLAAEPGVARLRAALAEPGTVDRFTLLGTPGADDAWGFRLAGPRLIVDTLVAGDVVLVSPVAIDPPTPLVAAARVNPSAP